MKDMNKVNTIIVSTDSSFGCYAVKPNERLHIENTTNGILQISVCIEKKPKPTRIRTKDGQRLGIGQTVWCYKYRTGEVYAFTVQEGSKKNKKCSYWSTEERANDARTNHIQQLSKRKLF